MKSHFRKWQWDEDPFTLELSVDELIHLCNGFKFLSSKRRKQVKVCVNVELSSHIPSSECEGKRTVGHRPPGLAPNVAQLRAGRRRRRIWEKRRVRRLGPAVISSSKSCQLGDTSVLSNSSLIHRHTRTAVLSLLLINRNLRNHHINILGMATVCTK